MMHNRAGRKLRRRTSHRLAMFANQLDSLMTHERIQTTLTKAKELRPLAEKLITAAKNDGVAARRKVAQWIPSRTTVRKVFENIAPRFVDRPGGYTRILRLGSRQGDGAEAAILELVDYRFEPKEKGPRKESLSDRARRASGGRVDTVRKEKADGEDAVPDAASERKASPKKAKPSRDGMSKVAKPAPKKGPSRTGPSKRGA
jgi:large subunit ribosomal protein L17